MHSTKTTHDGARIYSPLLLSLYDFLIMNVLSPYVWRCAPRHFVDLYHDCMSPNHADIGVGTGYVLNQCAYQPGQVRIGLFDLQQNCLDYTARRLARFQPETYRCDALARIEVNAARFDSIALGGILHCIPGDLADKGAVFDAIEPLMHGHTKVFGYTLLNQGVAKTLASRVTYWLLEQLKVINGPNDSASQLQQELKKRFTTTEVTVIGCVALFVAHSPITHPAPTPT